MPWLDRVEAPGRVAPVEVSALPAYVPLETELSEPIRSEAHRLPRWLWPALGLFVLCRIPSFYEPHWYTDEAGYATVARMVSQGLDLYSQAWTNKPPLQIWTVALSLKLFGLSEAGLHLLTFISGLAALLAVAWVAGRLLDPLRAGLATSAFALAIGLPWFEAEVAVPESLLLGLATWAGALVVMGLAAPRHSRWWRWGWAPAAGILVGAAGAYQQTELADALALTLVLILSPRVSWRQLSLYLAAVLAVTAAWLLPSVVIAGASTVRFSLAGFYVDYAAASSPGVLGDALCVAAAIAVLAGAVGSRRSPSPIWAIWVWAAADLGVAAIAHRPYPHFLTPALAPSILALASVPVPPWRLPPRIVPLVGGVVLVALLAGVSGVNQKAVFNYGVWYWKAVSSGQLPRSEWLAGLDDRVTADQEVAEWLRAQGLEGTCAVVWSSDAWPYLLAGIPVQLPTAPIYNDVVLSGGSDQAVTDQVSALHPTVIVVAVDAVAQWPSIQGLLDRQYQLALASYPDLVYVRRGLHLPASASEAC
jgi:4-amino-4-deoxy-L-arabinose transferase-like glycosyltransferase